MVVAAATTSRPRCGKFTQILTHFAQYSTCCRRRALASSRSAAPASSAVAAAPVILAARASRRRASRSAYSSIVSLNISSFAVMSLAAGHRYLR